jgi:hypothetical protein
MSVLKLKYAKYTAPFFYEHTMAAAPGVYRMAMRALLVAPVANVYLDCICLFFLSRLFQNTWSIGIP